jgi:S1-C subfamily serine protease
MESTLVGFSNELAGIVQRLSPFVVSVGARRRYPSSGLLWSPNVIVTAAHTVQQDEDISLTTAGGKTLGATLVGRDPGTDIAVLKADLAELPGAAPGRAIAVSPGELALVLGRSPHSGANASCGIVSAVSGPWKTWRGGELDSYIRLDARLFPQSSGGAVVNMSGEIIGIASSALSRIAGLAIPAANVKRVTEQLLGRGFVPRGYLGIGIQTVALPEELRTRLAIPNHAGLMVLAVESDGPADKAGLLIGDIVTRLGDVLAERIDELQTFSGSGLIGKSVQVQFIRGGVLKESTLTVAERPGRRN